MPRLKAFLTIRKLITFAVVGFFVVWFGGVALAQGNVDANAGATALGLNTTIQQTTGLGNQDIRIIIANIIRVALGLLGITTVVLMVYAGYMWMTSAGEEEKVAAAKNTIKNAAIGLAIILSAYAIVSFVISKLLEATQGLPAHCYDGVQNFDETGVDSGGSCSQGGGGGGSLGQNALYIVSLPSAGNACIANYRPIITFNRAVDIATMNPQTIYIEKADLTRALGDWQYVNPNSKNTVQFIPVGSCGPGKGNDCFEPDTDYHLIIVSDNVSKTSQIHSFESDPANVQSLRCDLKAGCGPVFFKTGTGVDVTPPQVTITYPTQGALLAGGGSIPVRLSFTDDSGVQSLQLYSSQGTPYAYNGNYLPPAFINFAPRYSITNSAAADLDDDGKLDLITASSGNAAMRIYKGDGNGGFAFSNTVTFGQPVYHVKTGDINGDGKTDIIATGQYVLATMTGKGDGTFNPPVLNNLTAVARGLLAKDLNGDGKTDAVVAEYIFSLPHILEVFVNKGDGTFNPPVKYEVGFLELTTGNFIEAADLNNDKRLDLIVPNYASSSIQVLLGNGNGTFAYGPTTSAKLLNGADSTLVSVAAGDFDKDKNIDLATANFYNDSVSVFRGKGDGTFNTPVIYAGLAHDPNDIIATDLNRDGNIDLVATALLGGATGQIYTLLNQGNGTYAAPQKYTVSNNGQGSHATAILTGDFNTDQLPDFGTVYDDTSVNESGLIIYLSNHASINPAFTLEDSVSLNNCQKSGTVELLWPTAILKGGLYTLMGRALDYAAQDASSTRIVNLRPGTCYNSVLDPGEDQVGPPACGTQSICGFCAGDSCQDNADCASNECVFGPGAQQGVCINKAQIVDYSPRAAGVGSLVSIKGFYFGSRAGKVYFAAKNNPDPNNLNDWVLGSLSACGYNGWSDRQIITEVPPAAVNGPIMIVTAPQVGADGKTRTFVDTTSLHGLPNFTLNNVTLPGICSVDPTVGPPGRTVVISGKKFGLLGGQDDYVQFGQLKGTTAQNAWKDDQINTQVANLAPGFVALSVFSKGQESNRVEFEVSSGVAVGTPFITSSTPSQGANGEYITLSGNNFGNTLGQVWFKANANAQAILGDFSFPAACNVTDVWKNDKIIVKFPKGVGVVGTKYFIQVKPADAKINPSPISNNIYFSLENGQPSPGLCKIDPVSAAVPFGASQVAKVYGEYFSATNPADSINRANLTVYYSFNKNTVANDTVSDGSGSNNNGVLKNAPTLGGGVYDEAINFENSKNQYIEVANGAGLNAANEGSIAMWVKWNGAQAKSGKVFGPVVSRQEDNVFSNYILGLSASDPNNAKIVWQPYDDTNFAIVGNTTVGDGVWHQVVVTFKSGEHFLYVDGKEDGTGNTVGNFADRPAVPVQIGRWLAGANASIDDILFYKRILTRQEVSALFNSASGVQVYFWKAGASVSAINGRTAASIVGGADTILNIKPPADAQSGPVVAYRPGDQQMSNPVAFTVLDCVKNNNQCGDVNLKCCAAGPDTGSCKQPQDLCAGESRSTGYVWRFSTKDIPEIPHVVERCDDDGVNPSPTLPTPSPSVAWKSPSASTSTDPQYNVCRTALAAVEFSTAIDQATVNNGTVNVYKCTAFNADGTCKTWSALPQLDPSSYNLQVAFQNGNVRRDSLFIMLGAKKWDDNSWYQVVLSTGIKSEAQPGNVASLAPDSPCDGGGITNSAYCFRFRTDNQDCILRSVLITPYSYFTSYLEEPMLVHFNDKGVNKTGKPVPYSGNGLSGQRCIMMDMSEYDWQWDTQKPNNTTFAQIFGPSNNRVVNVSSLLNTIGIAPQDKVDVQAIASKGPENKSGVSPLTIDLTKPEVVEAWPNCLEACTNAEVGVRFNVTLNRKNLPGAPAGGTVQLLECLDENCLATNPVLDLNQVVLDQSSNYTVLKIGNSQPGAAQLKPDTKYQVILSAAGAPGDLLPNQLWSSYKFGDPSPANAGVPYNQVYTWSFKTKKEACSIERVDVQPSDFITQSIFSRAIFTATPYSAPDSCSATGQKLDAWSVNWQWQTEQANVATVKTYSTKQVNPSCTASCVRKGSDVPSGNSSLLPVCGNGKVEAGEDCDTPDKNKACGLDCRRLGNPDNATCGNGIVEGNLGETCDTKDPATQINCSATCLRLGSTATPNPNNPQLSICGNGTRGSGEDCDLGIAADISNNQSALGCNTTCQHQGTKLAKFWCQTNLNNGSLGNFTQQEFNAACKDSFSVCGDGYLDTDEDLGCDGNGGWNQNLCNEYCLLKSGDSAPDINNNSCGVNPNVVPSGCNADLQHMGSSVLYTQPSVCGDGAVGAGEDATCETNLVGGALTFNPWVLTQAVGKGTVNDKVSPPEQRSKITGSTNQKTKNNATVAGNGNFVIQCGYKSDSNCTDIDPALGLGSDTCCYARPSLVGTFPVTSTPVQFNVCPNTYISATFDQPIDGSSLSGNVLIARGSDDPCAPGTIEVTNQLAKASGIKTPQPIAWFSRWYEKVSNFVRSLFGLTVEARIYPDPAHWCVGSDIGTASVSEVANKPGYSTVNVKLSRPLATSTNYAVLLNSGIKSALGVSVGAKTLWWKFNTNSDICSINAVTVNPNSWYFGKAGATATLSAYGTYVDAKGKPQLLQSIAGYYSWNFVWGPQENDVVSLSNETSNTTTVITAKNRNGEIDIRAAANITENAISTDHGIVATGKSHITVFLCENPWPPKQQMVNGQGPYTIFPYEDSASNNDNYDIQNLLFNNTPIPATDVVFDGFFNFRTYYCADSGANGYSDDLPYLRPSVQSSKNVLEVLPSTCELSGETCSRDSDCGIRFNSTSTGQEFLNASNGNVCASVDQNQKPTYYISQSKSLSCNNVAACNGDAGFAAWQKSFGGSVGCVAPPVLSNQALCYAHRPLKRFFFTNNNNSDSIGIQVFENRNFLSAEDWFRGDRAAGGQGFAGQLSRATIGGYDAVTDGNNYYVEALNYASSTNAQNQLKKNLYSTIYLFSINSDAKPATRQVFDQLRANLSFNTNLTNYGYCGPSVSNPGFKEKCSNDFDCAPGEVCSVQVDKLRRNYDRLHDLRDIESALKNYADQNLGKYPDLKAGSFLTGHTISVWPQSWTLLGNQISGKSLPADPVNQLGVAGTCASNTAKFCTNDGQCGVKLSPPAAPNTPDTCVLHDSATGWSTADRRFSFACASSSLAYRYIFSTTTGYQLRAQVEDPELVVDNSQAISSFFINPKQVSLGGLGICTENEEITSVESGRCGDGIVNLNKNEQCDPPGKKSYGACSADRPNQIRVDSCSNSCKWDVNPTYIGCNDLSKCGNGKREGTETCDDGNLNGRVGHCNAFCDGFSNTCGNNIDDQGELCEYSDTSLSADRGWCIGGAAGTGTHCNPANGNNDCNLGRTYSGICYSVDKTPEKYGLTKASSCGFDCQTRGPYCGNGVVEPEYGEECDGDVNSCVVSNTQGKQFCSTTCKFSNPQATLWLRFNDAQINNQTYTYSGQGGSATCTGSCPGFVANQKFEGALNFNNGSTGRLSVPHSSGIMATSTGFTLEAWINPDDIGAPNGRILEKGGWKIGPGYDLEFNIVDENGIRFNLWRDADTFTGLDSTATLKFNDWTHVVATYERQLVNQQNIQIMKLYINGYENNVRYEVNKPDLLLANNNPLVIGQMSNPNADDRFPGMIDEIRYYPKPLQAAEVMNHYKSLWACSVNLAAQPVKVVESGVCGDGKVGANEACDNGAKNGQVCKPAYGKSCTYCSNTCANIITVEANQFCGNGIIEANEFCDTDQKTKTIYAAQSNVTSTFAQLSHNGYEVKICPDELALKYTAKKGTKVCANSCTRIISAESGQDGCIVCGFTGLSGQTVAGGVINVADPLTDNPLLGSLSGVGGATLDLTMSQVHNDKWAGIKYYNNRSDITYSLVPPNESGYYSVNSTRVGSDPICSNTSDLLHYRMFINADNTHAIDFPILSDPKNINPWRFDLVVSPIIPANGIQGLNPPLLNGVYEDNIAALVNTKVYNQANTARPNDVRVVVKWHGEATLVLGVVAIDALGVVTSVESNSLTPILPDNAIISASTFYYRKVDSWKINNQMRGGIWNHGQGNTATDSHSLAMTLDTWDSQNSGRMNSAQYYVYVRTADNSPIQNLTTNDVQVEFYYAENDNNYRHFARPRQTFKLTEAQKSDNARATFWQVANLNRADVANDTNRVFDFIPDPLNNQPQTNGRIVTGKEKFIATEPPLAPLNGGGIGP